VSDQTRDERLFEDLEALRSLRKKSTIFDFEMEGDEPERYTVTFRGKGIHRENSDSDVQFVELHKCDIRLPYSYPERAPDIRWLTPILHPNISFSGFLTFREIDLPWDRAITLDVVCERLWDMARLAHMNLERASNYRAKQWLEKENTLKLPVDHRPLRDKNAPNSSNVISYERRGGSKVTLPKAKPVSDVFYIGDETAQAARKVQAARRPPVKADDDDVFYIGE
jgi:ubiquitin-protein ligase